MSMTDAELQERVEALAEKIRHDIVVVAANTMASTLLCEHDLVLYHAAMFAARAQGAKAERERCAEDIVIARCSICPHQDDPERETCDRCETYAALKAIRNPAAETGKEH